MRFVGAEEERVWVLTDQLASTIIDLRAQIAAVLAEHPTLRTLSGSDVWCGGCGRSWPCPTARALGVTA